MYSTLMHMDECYGMLQKIEWNNIERERKNRICSRFVCVCVFDKSVSESVCGWLFLCICVYFRHW